MSRWKTAAIVLCCIVLAGSTASRKRTGSVPRDVTDDTGAVLPGATVVLSE